MTSPTLSLLSDQETLDCSPISAKYPNKFVNDALSPEDYCFLFDRPSEKVFEDTETLMKSLTKIVHELEDSVQPANIRDEFSVQPQNITLLSGKLCALKRRRTVGY